MDLLVEGVAIGKAAERQKWEMRMRLFVRDLRAHELEQAAFALEEVVEELVKPPKETA